MAATLIDDVRVARNAAASNARPPALNMSAGPVTKRLAAAMSPSVAGPNIVAADAKLMHIAPCPIVVTGTKMKGKARKITSNQPAIPSMSIW
jgi:hypothetical protein